jgi:hypothetical protein
MIMTEFIGVRFFKGDRKKRSAYMKFFKHRWDNDSHFIRSACIVYMRQLEQEKKDLNKSKVKKT